MDIVTERFAGLYSLTIRLQRTCTTKKLNVKTANPKVTSQKLAI